MFYVGSVLVNKLSSAVHKLLCALRKKQYFWFGDKPRMHRFCHFLATGGMVASQSICDGTKHVTVRWIQMRTIRRMLGQHLKIQLTGAFNGVGGSVYGRALSCDIETHFDNSPLCLVRTASFIWSRSISLYRTLFIIVRLSRQCSKIGPCVSQKLPASVCPPIVEF